MTTRVPAAVSSTKQACPNQVKVTLAGVEPPGASAARAGIPSNPAAAAMIASANPSRGRCRAVVARGVVVGVVVPVITVITVVTVVTGVTVIV